MEEAEASRYWCHMCSQTVNPIMEIETIKCPICQSGFVEEMASASTPGNDGPLDFGLGGSDSDRALSLWAPILLGMMGNPRHHRQLRRMEFEDVDEDDNESNHRHNDGQTEVDQELESIMRRRRRRSAAILQLLQGIRAGMLSESGNSETDNSDRDNNNNNRDGQRVILINPFNQTIIVLGSTDPNNEFHNRVPIGSLGDYFIGPSLDLLLQHLAENDPNRYGTPPARKEAVDALPIVKIEETMQCSVCLDGCEMGAEVKEMPCKHKFHSRCIVPWLELHGSCPVCRYQLPSDESKLDTESSRNSSSNSNQESIHSNHGAGNGEDNRNENGRRFSIPLLWPFNSLFSSSSSQTSGGNSSLTSPSGSSTTNAPATTSHADEN